ncbi:acetyl-CoA acetyltransferase [Myxococcota bacterium]|nr:acetyl-CoA acetyltransferase [Myxococcota bacterium]
MQRKTAVVGVGESEYFNRGGATVSEFELACTAIRNAVEDAGLPLSDVDGFVSYLDARNDPVRLSAALGLPVLNFSSQTWGGGGNGVASSLMIADAAVSAGYAEVVVAFRALAQGQFGRFGQARAGGGPASYTAHYGVMTAAQICAIQTQRFMYENDVPQDALAEISLASFAHAQRNPRAVRYGRPLTREEYHESRWIAEPLHLFDCCPENDGAAAVVITSMERARDLRKPPVPILAAAQGIEHGGGIPAFNESNFPTAHHRHAGEMLWQRAGVGPGDVQVAQFYENFTGPVLMAMAEMGFCAPEEIASFVSNGNIQWPDGNLPINTSGGNLGEAYIHGFENINEAVRQVRGESTCQVEGVELSLSVSGPGFAPGSTILFCRD